MGFASFVSIEFKLNEGVFDLDSSINQLNTKEFALLRQYRLIRSSDAPLSSFQLSLLLVESLMLACLSRFPNDSGECFKWKNTNGSVRGHDVTGLEAWLSETQD
jgi:hypothetical protein